MRCGLTPGWFICLSAIVLAGCQCNRAPSKSAAVAEAMFAPTSMRIHPIFTQIEDWTSDGNADGIDAQLEFQDQFGDPTKASGRAMFELFEYRRDSPDPRGKRVGGPWTAAITTQPQQRKQWNTTLRTYSFQLPDAAISKNASYVLSAVFDVTGGRRFFDRIVLPAKQPVKARKARLKL